MIVTVKKVDRSVNFGVKDPRTGRLKPKYDNCHEKWVVGISKTTGMLNTGLSKATEAKFEKELALSEGELSKTSKYWESFSIIIPGEGLQLDTSIPDHKLKLELLKADPTVVEGENAVKRTAKAEYVLLSEEGEAKAENTKRNVIAKAYSLFNKLTKNEKVDALYMFGKYGDDLSPEVVENRLGEIVDDNPAYFLQVVGDELFKEKVWMMKLIKEGIVKKHGTGKGTNMPLYFEDIMLGNGLEEAIVFINDKENQAVQIGLKKAYNA